MDLLDRVAPKALSILGAPTFLRDLCFPVGLTLLNRLCRPFLLSYRFLLSPLFVPAPLTVQPRLAVLQALAIPEAQDLLFLLTYRQLPLS